MMEEQDSKVTQYLVPANVSARFEFFPGFGFPELIAVVIALIIGAALFFLSGVITKTIILEELPFEYNIGGEHPDIKVLEDGTITRKVPFIPGPLRVILFIVIPGLGTYFFVKKEPTSNMSVYETFKAMRAFKQKQKRYMYVYNSGSEVK